MLGRTIPLHQCRYFDTGLKCATTAAPTAAEVAAIKTRIGSFVNRLVRAPQGDFSISDDTSFRAMSRLQQWATLAWAAARSRVALERTCGLLSQASQLALAKERDALAQAMEEFLARGGKVQEVEPNVVADPPKKPDSKYGSRPI